MAGRRRAPRRYEIRIRGHLGRSLRAAFADLDARVVGNDTLLTGALRDQAALHGVFAMIESLGLELLEFRRLPNDSSASDGTDQ
jgi:hypothetical protein